MRSLRTGRTEASRWLLLCAGLTSAACGSSTPSPAEPAANSGNSGIAGTAGVGGAAGGGAGGASMPSGGEVSMPAAGAAGAPPAGFAGAPPAACMLGMGQPKKIFVPQPTDGVPWYINDHTIVRGPDNLWHMFGITHEEPQDPAGEITFAHATSPTLTAGNWKQLPPALTADPAFGEKLLWAPYVIEVDNVFYMFYCGGGADDAHYQIELATSTDLMSWTRQPKPLFVDGYTARDPFVLRVNDQWVLYYTATTIPTSGDGNHIVAYRTSTDLLQWSSAKVAYLDSSKGGAGGPTESPFVIAHNGGYYLFIGPRDGYVSTEVIYSTDPLHFEASGVVPSPTSPTLLPSHAAEIVTDLDGQLYITTAGWAQGGLSLAQLSLPCP